MTHLLLGRRGDITALLPVLQHRADNHGALPELVVSRDCVDILSGVSYVKPLVYPGPPDRALEARNWVRRNVVDCTVYGIGFHRPPECNFFDRDIWWRSGIELPFDTLPLVFDRRDAARERQLIDAMPRKPVVLVSLSGVSSPFREASTLVARLTRDLPGFTVYDVSTIPLHTPHDMLAWMDHAYCLITSDSLPLHLSRVSGVPTICLLNDQYSGWESSAWRPHHVLRMGAKETFARYPDIIRAVYQAYEQPIGRLVTSQGPTTNLDVIRRMTLARESRNRELSRYSQFWRSELALDEPLPRNATSLGEVPPLPFIRDLVERGFEGGSDFVALSNADIGFTPGITGQVLDALAAGGACWAHRWDFYRVNQLARSEAQVRKARWYPGSDFFAFTRDWWNTHGRVFPDMVLGREAWDLIMRHTMRRAGGREIHLAIYHERHESPWEVTRDLPGNGYNRKLAEQWMAEYGGGWNDWDVKPVYK